MTEIMMSLGHYVFALETAAYQQLRHTQAWRWAAQMRVGLRPAQQYVGPGAEQITLNGVIYPHFKGGLSQVNTMRKEAAKGQPLVLVAGTGDVWGQWVISQIEETWTHLHRQGLPQKITFRLQLKHYGEDP